MLIVFPFLGLLQFTQSRKNNCKKELENAIYKPKVCGYNYFEAFEKEIKVQSSLWFAQSSTQCKTFGAQHAVGVHVYDAMANTVCSFPGNYSDTLTAFNFQNISIFGQIFDYMKFRTPVERYSVYQQLMQTAFPPNTPDYDYLNNGIILGGGYSNQTQFYEAAFNYLALAPGGSATVADSLITAWAEIFNLLNYVSPQDISFAYAGVLTIARYITDQEFFILFEKTLAEDLKTPFFVSSFFYFVADNAFKNIPNRYDEMIAFLIRVVYGPNSKMGIARQWSINVPLNVVEFAECKYAFNLRNEFGEYYKIVLVQSQHNLQFSC